MQLPGPITAGDISANGSEIILKGYTFARLFQRSTGVSVGDALDTTACMVSSNGRTGWAHAAAECEWRTTARLTCSGSGHV
jgi:hypothetical protein